MSTGDVHGFAHLLVVCFEALDGVERRLRRFEIGLHHGGVDLLGAHLHSDVGGGVGNLLEDGEVVLLGLLEDVHDEGVVEGFEGGLLQFVFDEEEREH